MEIGLGNDLVSGCIRRSMELLIFFAQEPIVDEVGMVGFGITIARLSARYASDVLHDVSAGYGFFAFPVGVATGIMMWAVFSVASLLNRNPRVG